MPSPPAHAPRLLGCALAACALGCGGGFHPLGDGGADGGTDGGDAISTLADTRAAPIALAVATASMPTIVYWAEQGSSTQAGRDGAIASARGDCTSSCPTVLEMSRPVPSGIALSPDATELFWSELENVAGDTAQGTVWQLDLGTMQTSQLAAMQTAPRGLVATATSIFWAVPDAGEVRREDYPGGTIGGLPILSGLPSPWSLAVTVDMFGNADTIFGTAMGTNGSDGSVWSSDSRGMGLTGIASGLATPTGITFDTSWVYWVDTGTGLLEHASRSSGAESPIASSLASPEDVAVDRDWIYWVEAGTAPFYRDGRVAARRIDGTDPRVLADGRRSPTAIGLDAGNVYWTEFGTRTADQFDGGVYRVAKPK
jgi:hypothetical protein